MSSFVERTTAPRDRITGDAADRSAATLAPSSTHRSQRTSRSTRIARASLRVHPNVTKLPHDHCT
jgi:hypothetical protein